MKQIHGLLGLVAVIWFGTGCIPMCITSSPGVSGMVVDAETHAAIAGVHAAVCRRTFFAIPPSAVTNFLEDARSPQVSTRANGRFSIRSEHQWILYFPSPMMMPATGDLVLWRDGYEPVRLPLTADPKWHGFSAEFLTGDITNLPAFAAKLKASDDGVSAWLLPKFSASARTAVAAYPAPGMSGELLQSILVKELNVIIQGPVIYEKDRFRGVTLSPEVQDWRTHERALIVTELKAQADPEDYPGGDALPAYRSFINRRLLEDAYPGELSGRRESSYYKNVGVVLLQPVHD